MVGVGKTEFFYITHPLSLSESKLMGRDLNGYFKIIAHAEEFMCLFGKSQIQPFLNISGKNHFGIKYCLPFHINF